MKKYYVYKTTNLINNKIYIGVHGTNNFNDSYIGSGTMLSKAIKSYGRENFKKECLYEALDKDDAYNKEREIVTQEFISSSNTYNISIGGYGGLQYRKSIIALDLDGNKFKVSSIDPRILNGTLSIVGTSIGQRKMINQATGEEKIVYPDQFKFMKDTGWEMWNKHLCRFTDSNGTSYRLKTDDEKIKQLNLKPWTKDMKVMKDIETGEVLWVHKKDVDDSMKSIVKDTVTVKDSAGIYYRVDKTDERYISGELVGVNKGRSSASNHLNNKLFKCVHCEFETSIGNITRWHNDNCKKHISYF